MCVCVCNMVREKGSSTFSLFYFMYVHIFLKEAHTWTENKKMVIQSIYWWKKNPVLSFKTECQLPLFLFPVKYFFFFSPSFWPHHLICICVFHSGLLYVHIFFLHTRIKIYYACFIVTTAIKKSWFIFLAS